MQYREIYVLGSYQPNLIYRCWSTKRKVSPKAGPSRTETGLSKQFMTIIVLNQKSDELLKVSHPLRNFMFGWKNGVKLAIYFTLFSHKSSAPKIHKVSQSFSESSISLFSHYLQLFNNHMWFTKNSATIYKLYVVKRVL